ncbi:hypothetical protein O1L60_24155 [Streptomyces diastatochromogenes]|nr:hypothetical protein [Streptomyces diastatochromogenes]
MKQSAAKKLGVAALGAAFAVTAAGTASAASSLPLDADALGTVTSATPLGDGLTTLPDGATEALGAGQGALGQGLDQGVKTSRPPPPGHPERSARCRDRRSRLHPARRPPRRPAAERPAARLTRRTRRRGAHPELRVRAPSASARACRYQAEVAVFSEGRKTHRPR